MSGTLLMTVRLNLSRLKDADKIDDHSHPRDWRSKSDRIVVNHSLSPDWTYPQGRCRSKISVVMKSVVMIVDRSIPLSLYCIINNIIRLLKIVISVILNITSTHTYVWISINISIHKWQNYRVIIMVSMLFMKLTEVLDVEKPNEMSLTAMWSDGE